MSIVVLILFGLLTFIGALAVLVAIVAWRDLRRLDRLSEAQAAANSAPWRPNVFPIDPAYVGLGPHNGRVKTSGEEEGSTA